MFSTSSHIYDSIMNTTALTATTNTFDMSTTIQRPLFASLASKTSDAEDLLHPGFYPVPAISKLGRGRQPSHGLREQNFPAAALASAISRKLPTLAQMVSADAADMEDTDALFALIASTNETLLASTPMTPAFPRAAISKPIHVPTFSFDSFDGTTMLDASRPHSRGSSSTSSFEYESDVEFDFEDAEDIDDGASVSSVSSVESCFDFLASTKPQSQTRAQSPAALQVPAPIARPAPSTTSSAIFVPPQVRANMNMLRFSRARAQSTASDDSISSGTSSTDSWRSSASSRTSISSLSSVSSTPAHKTKPTSPSTSPSIAAPAPASQAAKTKYLYQGGVSTVLGGGVMLGGASAKPHQNRQPQKPTTRLPATNTTATAPSWRRGAPPSMFSRA